MNTTKTAAVEQEEFTNSETIVLNVLMNLEKNERVSVPFIARYTGIQERTVYEILESLRVKGVRVISSKKCGEMGTCLARSEQQWHEYLERREREVQTNLESLEKMKKATPIA